MKVSVIIPAYRAERYLAKALESVANQTHRDWEIRIHEDGVFDESKSIIDAFAAEHPGLVFHSSTPVNAGVSKTRNCLMDSALGDCIAFLDADDLWRPMHLEAALASMSVSGADWYVAGMQEIGPQEQVLAEERLPPTLEKNEIAPSLLSHNFIPTSLAVLGPRSVRHGFRFDTRLKVGEDLDLWIRLLELGYFPALAKCATISYRRHESNTTNDPIYFAEEFSKVFEKHLSNTSLPPGACLRGVEIMLGHVVKMTRFRAPHRAFCAMYRIHRSRWRARLANPGRDAGAHSLSSPSSS